MRIISFSADGIQSAADSGFYQWLQDQDADFVCVQNLRCSEYALTIRWATRRRTTPV